VSSTSQPEVLETPGGRFRIYYWLRTPRQGHGMGLEGIADMSLVRAYDEALEDAYRRLGSRGLGWSEPSLGEQDRINVQIWNHPYAHVKPRRGNEGGAFICLRSELMSALTSQEVFAQARVEATHEVVHLFTSCLDVGNAPGWAWFDEATAAYFALEFNKDNVATLCNNHAMSWVNFPEAAIEIYSPPPPVESFYASPGHEPTREALPVKSPDQRTYNGAWLIKYVEPGSPARRSSSGHGTRPRRTTRRVIFSASCSGKKALPSRTSSTITPSNPGVRPRSTALLTAAMATGRMPTSGRSTPATAPGIPGLAT
jgi:hypothetical protein